LISNPITEAPIRASVIEIQINTEELQQKAKVCSIENLFHEFYLDFFFLRKKDRKILKKMRVEHIELSQENLKN
jgi:hypothetical protein